MDDAIRARLEAADHTEACEAPPGFDREAALARVADLRHDVEAVLDHTVTFVDDVQDASFFADLSFERGGRQRNTIETVVALRFSCFGSLVTTWSCAREPLSPERLRALAAVVEAAGFVFVDPAALAEPYDGPNCAIRDIPGATWYYRFFDYL